MVVGFCFYRSSSRGLQKLRHFPKVAQLVREMVVEVFFCLFVFNLGLLIKKPEDSLTS